MDLCAVRETSETEIMRFETVTHFRRYDSVFGKYSRFRTTEVLLNIGGAVVMRHYHHITTMGEGVTQQPPKFYRKNVPTSGVDLKFNLDRLTLLISVRYSLVCADRNETIMGFISDRQQQQKNSTIPADRFRNVQTSYSDTIKKDMEFLYNNAQ